jgi:type I restriction enzyme M protein
LPIKKSVLYRSIWQACDELRGGMDASQYKDYILVLLFVKYLSDRTGKPGALFEAPEGARYSDLLALKGQKDIGDRMNKIIRQLGEATDLVGVLKIADFNEEERLGRDKEMVERLSKLVAIFDRPDLDFSEQNPAGDDILGDAYEYLMRHFAVQSGKSKGQFYTPGEVSRVIAQVIGVGQATTNTQSIYDPTCGSGSLLLRAYDEAHSRTGLDLTLYGQEMDNATFAMARMNLIVHKVETAGLWRGNTLAEPHFKEKGGQLKTFDFVVANPPFSDKAWTSGVDLQQDTRFAYGTPPTKNGDYAFLLHVLASLKSTGQGAIILPHGVLFRGGAEADIRKNLIQRGFIKGIIGLPANLFYGTGIPACILLLDKEHAVARKGIFMIDASKGFMKDGNKNRLRERDIHRIVDAYTRQLELPRFSRLVPVAEVERNGFNLNLPRYIDTTDPEDLQDLEGHLRGGIPERDVEALGAWWTVLPGLREVQFEPLRPGFVRLKVVPKAIKPTIFGHPAFAAFQERVRTHFMQWKAENKTTLENIGPGQRPRLLIESLSAPLLAAFAPLPLIDPYAIYQHLMDYWAEQLQDDAWMLIQAGWKAKDEAGKPNRELIPPELIIRRHFAKEQAALEALEISRDAHSLALQELEEEHGGEEGLLFEAKNDKGKLTRVSVKARWSEVKGDSEAAEERKVLEDYLGKLDAEAAAGKQIKDAQKALDALVEAKYGELVEAGIRTLVVEDKWLAALADGVQAELDRTSRALTDRIRVLAERYARPLPELEREVEGLSEKVAGHLRKMGAVWS